MENNRPTLKKAHCSLHLGFICHLGKSKFVSIIVRALQDILSKWVRGMLLSNVPTPIFADKTTQNDFQSISEPLP